MGAGDPKSATPISPEARQLRTVDVDGSHSPFDEISSTAKGVATLIDHPLKTKSLERRGDSLVVGRGLEVDGDRDEVQLPHPLHLHLELDVPADARLAGEAQPRLSPSTRHLLGGGEAPEILHPLDDGHTTGATRTVATAEVIHLHPLRQHRSQERLPPLHLDRARPNHLNAVKLVPAPNVVDAASDGSFTAAERGSQ